MIKVNISFEAMEELVKDANKKGYVKVEGWNGVNKVRGFSRYVIWLSTQELEDNRPQSSIEDDMHRLMIRKVPNWQELFRYPRIYRLALDVDRDTLDRFITIGIGLKMLPKQISGSAYLGLILEAIGEELVCVKQ